MDPPFTDICQSTEWEFQISTDSNDQQWQFYIAAETQSGQHDNFPVYREHRGAIFTFLLTSSGQQWQFSHCLLTFTHQEWQFYIATEHLVPSRMADGPPSEQWYWASSSQSLDWKFHILQMDPHQHCPEWEGNFRFLLTSSGQQWQFYIAAEFQLVQKGNFTGNTDI